ncbi:MAG: SUMF1/EgtB/PvdO family nonheme iron enzyme [Planctomycetaceae bacterium]|nr:SUMF1/EgtB/PvdO family nonheme iron enzyme [Planctomycetaceae bacterium]
MTIEDELRPGASSSESMRDSPLLHHSSEESVDEHATIAFNPRPVKQKAVDSFASGTYMSNAEVDGKKRGRYRLDRVLGEGTFGCVFLGYDEELQRQVAIKVPAKERFERPSDAEAFLAEARIVARLDHPHIVPVYDMGRADDGSVYVVSRYVAGTTLEGLLKNARPKHHDSVVLVATIATALHYAHEQRLIHRDVKPANILIEAATGTPFLADFGLAVREDDYLRHTDFAGSPSYMSPEQACGEGHRLEGRSDLFSLGAIFYELLTGKRPFSGSSMRHTLQQVIGEAPILPRVFDHSIPEELERICLKALSKRARDRYPTGAAFAEDLQEWLKTGTVTALGDRVEKITPRGLRSFGTADASFFLDLLPGQRDRDGLPESVAFWKHRIESRDPEQTFSVGLLYGPSGCGKSSLVKAGLIPNLSPEVIAIHVDATTEETEIRLVKQLRKRLPDVTDAVGLVENMERIRRSAGPKVVLFIDQFEQWLYTHRVEPGGEWYRALRQCDGERLQIILMIRDDFYLAAARLMQEIEVPIVTDQNFRLVDLFDMEHAQNVLLRLGQAYGKLPINVSDVSIQQSSFLRQVIEGLSEDGKVVPVRLALLVEMIKARDWVPSTLTVIGGLKGIGVSFLEETFGSNRADVRYRQHFPAVRNILNSLLPETNSNIKGVVRTELELRNVSGYQQQPKQFQEVLRILDAELRLVTPTDVAGILPSEVESTPVEEELPANITGENSHFQLTHDFLVPAVREWLTRKQRETAKGRAELRLAERTTNWNALQENKQLPTFLEWVSIRYFTHPAKWQSSEQQLMMTANRYHTRRASVATASGVLLMVGFFGLRTWLESRQMERDASSLVSAIETASSAKLPELLSMPEAMRVITKPKLEAALARHDLQSTERLHLSLALLSNDPTQLEYLQKRLLNAEAHLVPLLVNQLLPFRDAIQSPLWAAAESGDSESLLPAACALAKMDPHSDRWPGISARIAQHLVRENPLRLAVWVEALRPVANSLIPSLQVIYSSAPSSRSQTEIDLATDILESYAKDDFALLHELVLTGEAHQFRKMFSSYQRVPHKAKEALRAELTRPVPMRESLLEPEERTRSRVDAMARQANAAVALLRLQDREPIYKFLTVDRNPEALTQFVYRIRGRDVSPLLLIECLQELKDKTIPNDAQERHRHFLRLYAFVLGLGEYSFDQLPAASRESLAAELAEMYATHPSRAVHSSLGWLLRRWGKNQAVRNVDETPLDYDPSGVREWYVLRITPARIGDRNDRDNQVPGLTQVPFDWAPPLYFTMIVFPGGEFEMGSQVGAPDPRYIQRAKVDGPIAVSDRELTWRQFGSIDQDRRRKAWSVQFQEELGGRQLLPDEPAFGVSWFDAVNYCRWLTTASGLDESLQSYEKIELPEGAEVETGWIDLPDDTEWPLRVDKPGFRLPTEVEWEYFARAGTNTTFSFGDDQQLASEYCWHEGNSNGWTQRTRQLRPSIGGLFDIHGNVWEWTDSWYEKGISRVYRGGGWDQRTRFSCSGQSSSGPPTGRNAGDGFRIVQTPSIIQPRENHEEQR